MNPFDLQLDFTHPEVRDLVWVISSPPLFNTLPKFPDVEVLDYCFFENEYSKLNKKLFELDSSPGDFTDFLQSKNTHLLGKYYESLIEYWLKISDDKELVSVNVQVHRGSNTIGEFDFIYRDLNRNQLVHLEAAGKFYLAYHNEKRWSNFVGPNPVDRLDNKIDKLFNHQIHLGDNRDAGEQLKRLGIEGKLTRQVMFKGYMFYHKSKYISNTFIIPENSSSNHPGGWWVEYTEFPEFDFDSASRWRILERDRWIARASYAAGEVMNFNGLIGELNDYFRNNQYPLLISELRLSESGGWDEVSRGFAVHPDWPHY